MKNYETKKIIKEEKILKEIICDKCSKIINQKNIYYEVTTHHCQWGNDSIDSYKQFEFCNKNCLLQHLINYLEDAENTFQYDIEVIGDEK